MKNKIMKSKWWKRVAPIVCALVLMIVSVVPVKAASFNIPLLNVGDSYSASHLFAYAHVDYPWYKFHTQVELASGSNVYAVSAFGRYEDGYDMATVGLLLISKSSFAFKFNVKSSVTADKDEVCVSDPVMSSTYSSKSVSYGGVTYHYYFYGTSGPDIDMLSFSEGTPNYCIDVCEYAEVKDYKYNMGAICEKFYNDGFVVDDGFSFSYSSSPSTQIAPPNGIRFNRSYSNEKKQYFCSLGWNKPIDEELKVEIMFNIHWKDGILGFGDHIYRKYNFVTYADEISAQQNVFSYYEDDFLKAYFEEQEMDLPSAYNIDELYVRFAKEVDGTIEYSLWQKINYSNLDEGNGYDDGEDDYTASNKTGYFDSNDEWKDTTLEDDEFKDGSETENSKSPGYDANGELLPPAEKDPLNPDIWDEDVTDVFKNFGSALSSAMDFIGDFPSMISEFFSFLPSPIIGCIGIGLLMLVLLRLLGR